MIITYRDIPFDAALKAGLYSHEDSVFNEIFTHRWSWTTSAAIIYRNTQPYDPLGIALTWYYPTVFELVREQIGCYVLPNHRRKGYGTQLIEALGGIGDREWLIGEKDSGEFWLSAQETTT